MRKHSKVLVVDDDPAITAVYEAAFEAANFAVQGVNSGSAAFAALRNSKPDVVVLDLNMPGTNGLRWLSTVRAVPDFKELPVVVLTAAREGSPEVEAAMAAGVNGVISKSQWQVDDVVAAVTAVRWSAARRDVVPAFDEPNWSQAPL